MPYAVFGPGIAIVTRIDIANQTPVNIGYAQELTIDFGGEAKQLHGQDQIALVIARGLMKCTGKMKSAMIQPVAFNNTFWGQTLAAGGFQWNVGENRTVPTGGGTITASLGATFDADLGVVYAATNVPLLRTTAAPTTGSYSTAAGGVYAFAAGDATLGVNLTYTSSVTVGQSQLIVNTPIGYTPAFQLDYWSQLNQPTAKPFAVRLYYCVGSKNAMSFKLSDFMMPEFDFEFGALQNGNVMNMVHPSGA